MLAQRHGITLLGHDQPTFACASSSHCLALAPSTLARLISRRLQLGISIGEPRRQFGQKEMSCFEEWRGRDESERRRAESQRIVAARPLCLLQYPVAYLSRLQRILPAARWELYFMATRAARPPHGLGQRHVPLGAVRPLLLVGKRAAGACVASSPDSDLEAFSHNPAHGSFAPLAFQPSAMTNCANQRFLSY